MAPRPPGPRRSARPGARSPRVAALLAALLAAPAARATDIYQAEMSDGSVLFTDSPSHDGFRPFLLDKKPLPTRQRVNTRTFPLLDTWDDEILDASMRHDVPPELIKAVALAESGMNPNALSPAGAQGLMQLMPGTARAMGVADAWDPEQNLEGGVKYLRKLMDTFPNLRHAVAAYNAGPGNVKKHRGIPPFEETRTYVVRVMDLYDHLLEQRPVVPEDAPLEPLSPPPR
jgi:soluble lytic murein transglycosylase-like protein